MVMSWIFTFFLGISVISAWITGSSGALAAAVPEGAQAGITLAFSMAGSLCLWTGVGKLLEKAGFSALLSRLLAPLLHRIFPGTKQDEHLSCALSGNICANILGLGNAATPLGIQAVRRMHDGSDTATDEMCRLVVLNTASIQLIPANVAAVRSALGSAAPFDMLPAVWITSFCSAALGLCAARLLGKVWRT